MPNCNMCNSFAVNVDPERELCDVCFYKKPLFDILEHIYCDLNKKYIDKDYLNEKDTRKLVKRAIDIIFKPKGVCEWEKVLEDDIEETSYNTSCGNEYSLNNSDHLDENYYFKCPCCGKDIKLKRSKQ